MKVLITGAAGFIGSNLVHYLVRERPAWKVTALDLLTYAGNLENLGSLLESKQVAFAKLDICDGSAIDALFEQEQFELVFHLAAESHVDRSIHSASEFVRTNVLGTQNLINAGRRSKVGRFVHISTDEVYGSLGPTGAFVETMSLDPTSPYAASKAASDLMVLAACKTHDFPAVVTRCTNNYGPFQFPEKFIPLFITNTLEDRKLPLYGDGMNVRSWIHVDDHCAALVLAAEQGRVGEAYNIGGSTEAEIPNLHVAKKILELLKKPDALIQLVTDRLAHDRRYAVDYSKAQRELGWQPQIGFEQGLRGTVEWYLAHREWWTKIKSGEYTKFYEQHYGRS